jgi:hypothetical protein
MAVPNAGKYDDHARFSHFVSTRELAQELPAYIVPRSPQSRCEVTTVKELLPIFYRLP